MTITSLTHEQQAEGFARAVRGHLADLPDAELDELLDGLQADLTERIADGDELGDPALYAEELRQAAGLPDRVAVGATPRPRKIGERLHETRVSLMRRGREFWDRTPSRRSVRDFLLSLRPVWWVIRGLVLTQLLMLLFGRGIGSDIDPLLVLVTAAFVVLSVQWGRGNWVPTAWLVALRRFLSVVAVLAVLPVTSLTWNALTSPTYLEQDPYAAYGLSSNGYQITNVFAFDCAGQPLDGVQLFDQRGEPITTLEGELGAGTSTSWGFDEERQSAIVYSRNGLADYSGMWNVFPLMEARDTIGRSAEDAQAKDAKWPMDEADALSPQCAAATDGADGSTTGTAAGETAGASSGQMIDGTPEGGTDATVQDDPASQ